MAGVEAERVSVPEASSLDERRTTRVRRTCPRCRYYGLHHATIPTREIQCTQCGHLWRGRLKHEEIADE